MSIRFDGDVYQLAYVTTNKDGKYRLDHLPFDRQLTINTSQNDWLDREEKLLLRDAEQTLDFILSPRLSGGSIIGVVTDRSGRPIADASLLNHGNSSRYVQETKSDSDGRFKLDNLFSRLGGPELIVRAKTFAPQRISVEAGTPDKPKEVRIKMTAGHKLMGRVIDEEGHDLEGVTVDFCNGGGPFSIGGRGTTDKNGRFKFDSLPADCPFEFYKQGFSAIGNLKLPLDTNKVAVVKMVPMGSIVGHVADFSSGESIRSFNVRITFSSKRQPNEPVAGLRGDLSNPGQSFQSYSGQFKLTDLVDGMPLQLMISADGYETCVEERVVARRVDQVEAVEFKLKPLNSAELRSFKGRLLDAKENPVVGAQLRLIASLDHKTTIPDRQITIPGMSPFNWLNIKQGWVANEPNVVRFLEGTTGKDGRFEFNDVPRKVNVEIAWWGDGLVSGRVDRLEKRDEAKGIDIYVPAAARIAGQFNREKYGKIGRIEVQPVDDFTATRFLELMPAQQEFEIGTLGPGKYVVKLVGPMEPLKGGPDGAMTNKTFSSVTVNLLPGDVKRITLP